MSRRVPAFAALSAVVAAAGVRVWQALARDPGAERVKAMESVRPPAVHEWAVAERQGRRSYMEDRHLVVAQLSAEAELVAKPPSLSPSPSPSQSTAPSRPSTSRVVPPRYSLFGVFDGHGGSLAARFVRDHVVRALCANVPLLTRDPAGALHAAVLSVDHVFVATYPHAAKVGTTVSLALLDNVSNTLTVAHCGDSRVVLCRGGGADVVATVDHKPSTPAERDRILAAGGTLGVVPDNYGPTPDAPTRVFAHDGSGGLSVSRAVGDAYLKNVPGFPPVGDHSLVLPDPATASYDLRLPPRDAASYAAAAGDAFLVLASDGLWDVCTPDDACGVVTKALQAGAPTAAGGGSGGKTRAQVAADTLASLALRRGSADNVTVVVVLFGAAPPPQAVAATSLPKSASFAWVAPTVSATGEPQRQSSLVSLQLPLSATTLPSLALCAPGLAAAPAAATSASVSSAPAPVGAGCGAGAGAGGAAGSSAPARLPPRRQVTAALPDEDPQPLESSRHALLVG